MKNIGDYLNCGKTKNLVVAKIVKRYIVTIYITPDSVSDWGPQEIYETVDDR